MTVYFAAREAYRSRIVWNGVGGRPRLQAFASLKGREGQISIPEPVGRGGTKARWLLQPSTFGSLDKTADTPQPPVGPERGAPTTAPDAYDLWTRAALGTRARRHDALSSLQGGSLPSAHSCLRHEPLCGYERLRGPRLLPSVPLTRYSVKAQRAIE